MAKVEYEIRMLSRSSGYYCVLWVSCGQNIFITDGKGSWTNTMTMVYEEVIRFQKGNSQFKTIEELHNFAYNKLGYNKTK